ncbi:Hypothetical predicted protein, partial [Pelobates cultripes]
ENQTWSLNNETCTSYSCQRSQGHLSTVIMMTNCLFQSAEDCKSGERFQIISGQCCGQCVKHSCIVKTSSGETKLLTAGELWYPSDDICTSYTCSKSDGPYSALENRSPRSVISILEQECFVGQEFQKSDNQCCGKCVQIACVVTTEEGTSKLLTGTIELSPDGCCNVCKAPRTCGLMLNNTVISVDGCTIQAEIPYCSGVCSISHYCQHRNASLYVDKMSTIKLEVHESGASDYNYEHVESCGCQTVLCEML